LNRAILDERPTAGGAYASPAKKVQGTKEKTCKPTVNPCCKSTANTKPACCDEKKVGGTKEKTCKPTVNPCCKSTANTKPACCDEKKGKVEGTQTKTCKPTRNPCCKVAGGKKASGSGDDFAPLDKLFI
jgi:septal ring-binding cell division protein DamX